MSGFKIAALCITLLIWIVFTIYYLIQPVITLGTIDDRDVKKIKFKFMGKDENDKVKILAIQKPGVKNNKETSIKNNLPLRPDTVLIQEIGEKDKPTKSYVDYLMLGKKDNLITYKKQDAPDLSKWGGDSIKDKDKSVFTLWKTIVPRKGE